MTRFPARLGVLFAVTLILIGCASQPPLQARPAGSADGTAYWARDIAAPLILGFAPDAQIYNVMGTQIYKDGRLAANSGDWSIEAWSPTRQQSFQVIVRADGTASATARSQTSGPGANGQPVPAGWRDSTVIFAAMAPHLDPSAAFAQLVVFNIATYSAPNWGVNFPGGAHPNHSVRWDGTYLP